MFNNLPPELKKRHVMPKDVQSASIDILSQSRDGNDLTNHDLQLCELGTNNNLSPLGVVCLLHLWECTIPQYWGA